MKDRLPRYPGRVTLTPVAGQENTFDMAMADEPTIDGTPLNKATLLQDATASAIDQSNPPTTPNEAFSKLNSFLVNAASAISTLQSSKARIITGSYTGTSSTTETVPIRPSWDTISVSNSYSIPVVFEKPPVLFWIFNSSPTTAGAAAVNFLDYGIVAPYLLSTAAFPATGADSNKTLQFENGFLRTISNNAAELTRYSNGRIYMAFANLSSSSPLTISQDYFFRLSGTTYRYLIVYDS